jgi:hypothetical protein
MPSGFGDSFPMCEMVQGASPVLTQVLSAYGRLRMARRSMMGTFTSTCSNGMVYPIYFGSRFPSPPYTFTARRSGLSFDMEVVATKQEGSAASNG